MTASERAEEVARSSYGRLLAVLAARTGDIVSAEDALADAFERALRTWPSGGIPNNPEGWIVTVAKNRWLDVARSRRETAEVETAVVDELDLDAIPDNRLELMFVCAHPAIDRAMHTPLMLQTVLGCEASAIARAFAMPTATMAQRLVRAKKRIKLARIPFVVPDRHDMASRLPPVLEAVYGAFAIDWSGVAGPTERDSLAGEALHLATVLATLLDDEPEALGLAALIALSLSRAPARLVDGVPVALSEQDPARWDARLIALGESHLRRAHGLGRIGRFQLEAAIQSVHCARAATGVTDWMSLRHLHEALVSIAPTLGARVSLAVVIAETEGAEAGLRALDAIDGAERFQPAWAARAHLLAAAGRDATSALDRAISLTTNAASRALLEARR